MARIYISSTYNDLKEYRKVVYATLRQMGHDAIAMEDYVATDLRPVDKCLEDVAASDLYVGIFAFAYGYVPDTANPDGKSITELEYRKAGDAGVPRLIFLVKEGAPWPTSVIDALVAGKNGQRILDLRKELERTHTDSFFESAEELARKVSVAVPKELERTRLQIDWEAARRRLIEHMRSFAGARSDQDAINRYVPLRLQATRVAEGGFNLPAGTWTDLVTYPARIVLTGEAGSGKTTLLLHEATRLSTQARERPDTPVPVYLSLKAFAGGTADTLLEMAAQANHMDVRLLRELWSEPRRPICLLLDGGDETAYRDELIDAVVELARGAAAPPGQGGATMSETRSLVVACHPGPLQDRIATLRPEWREFLLLPLQRTDIDAMLTRFDAASLIPILDHRRRQVVRRPDLLAALAQSAREASPESLPRNDAEIYTLYFQHIFSKVGGGYDYERIKRPVLARLAYDMLRTGQRGVPCDDSLYEWMATFLDDLYRRYHRRRRVMPHDWSAQELHDELLRSPVVDTAVGRNEMVTFSKALYRDYFAAVHLASAGATSEQARALVPILAASGELKPLSFVVGMDPQAATLLDTLLPASAPAAAQIWLEDGPRNVPVPRIIRAAYEACGAKLRIGTLDASDADDVWAQYARHADPRRRFDAVSDLASRTPLPYAPLLDAAADEHPLVRAIAHYALLHTGNPAAKLELLSRDGRFLWNSYGSGTAIVGPLKLLRLPIATVIDLEIAIDHVDFDAFNVDSEFSFVPLSSALFAAELFATRAGVDWLELLARLQQIAAASADLARCARSRTGLAPLAERFARHAADYASVGQLLAADLGLPWQTVDPPGVDMNHSAAAETYRTLRALFSTTHQARTLRLAHLAEDQVLDVSISSERLKGDTIGLRADDIHFRGTDDDETPNFAFIKGSRRVGTVEGGTVYGVDVDRMHGSTSELPLTLHISDETNIDEAVDAQVGAIRVHTLYGPACPWRVRARFRMGQFANSRFCGVVVENYDPRATAGTSRSR
jgi:hypothetical protein